MFPTKSSRSALMESYYAGYGIVRTDLPPYQSTRKRNGKFKTEECVNLRYSLDCHHGDECHFLHPENTQPERSNHRENNAGKHSDVEKGLQKVAREPTHQSSSMNSSNVGLLNGRASRIQPEGLVAKRESKDVSYDQSVNTSWASPVISRFRTESDRYSRNTPSRQKCDDEFLAENQGFDELWN